MRLFLAVLWIGVAVVGLALIFTDDPEPPTTAEIERSLQAAYDGERTPFTCEQMGAGWSCLARRVRYVVVADQERCWTGEKVRGRASAPARLEGCVDDVGRDPYESEYGFD